MRGHAFLSKTRRGSARASRSVPASAAFPQAHYSRGFINLSLRAGGRRGSRTGLTPRVEKRAAGSRSNLEAEGGPAYPRRSAAPSVVENRRLVSRLAKRLFYLDPAICQTPYELYTPSRRIVLCSCLSSPYRKVISLPARFYPSSSFGKRRDRTVVK